MTGSLPPGLSQTDYDYIVERIGSQHANARFKRELRHCRRARSWKYRFMNVDSKHSMHGLIRLSLRITGLYSRAQRNAREIVLRHNTISNARLPAGFDGYRLLHLSDLHLDMDRQATQNLIDRVREVEYDGCILTGDFRASTHGDSSAAMELMKSLREQLPDPVFAVLGNHDATLTLPVMERMGITVLMNEAVVLTRNGDTLALAGVDDAHYFRLADVHKARKNITPDQFSILLSHTPELFRRAASAGYDLFFCGHTHGGQLCLPGGIPILLEAKIPRKLGSGNWRWKNMQGYTSVGASTSMVNVRLNCPSEMTLHTLRCE